MRYLKSYKLFESVGKINFPTYKELHDFFAELEDDEITKFEYNDDNTGYLFFPQKWDRTVRSELYYDMSFSENWQNNKPDDLLGLTWNDFFMDPVSCDYKGLLRTSSEWIYLDDVKEKRTNLKKFSGSDTGSQTFEELFVEEIEKGNIKAYPFIYMKFDIFLPQHLDEVIERLKMVYEATDFRPLYGFWKDDYVDEDNGDIVDIIISDLYLVNVSDEEYQSLINIFNDYSLDKQVTKNFI
jgi:hypothetical protein